LFMVDAREGVTPLDKHFALWARKQPDPPEGPRKWVRQTHSTNLLMLE